MPQIPFVGDTYNSRSNNINASRAVNFFPEVSRSDSKDVVSLIGTPGTALFVASGALPIRGMHVFNNLLYFVAGNVFYSVNASGAVPVQIATINTFTGRVSMQDNGLSPTGGNQLILVDGVSGYIYNVSTNTFSTISSPGFPATGATSVAYLDGYFIVNNASPSISFYVSNLFDGTTWGALATGSASATSDPIQTIWSIHQQLVLIKMNSTEFFYDAGIATSTGSPFLRVPGAVIDYGTNAPFSLAQGDNTLYMLGQMKENNTGEFLGIVQLNGYVPQLISPVSINYQISQMTTTDDAFGYCYADQGHTFYVITFPTGNATYVYDATTQMWHERSLYSDSPYQVNRHVGNSYAFFSKRHLIGDYRNGNIYDMSTNYNQDNGNPIVSFRTTPFLNDKKDYDRFFIHRLWVDAETGSADNNVVPEGQLSWSDDGGHVFSNDYQSTLGTIGHYGARLLWRRLGVSRNRVWRLAISDNCRKIVLGAGMEATGGVS